MQHLPAGIQPQTAQQPAGVCHVCYVEDYSDDNLLLEVSLTNSACIGKAVLGCAQDDRQSFDTLSPDSSHVSFTSLC